jgi:hypothetical protein
LARFWGSLTSVEPGKNMTQLLAYIDRYLPYEEARLFWLKQGFRLLAVSLAGVHAWAAASNHSMNPDGISYLDIGDAYFRGDWEMAINTVWSPLYSWILGAVMWLIKPPMRWEFPLVHLVNFFIFLGALCAFEFMWSTLRAVRTKKVPINRKQIRSVNDIEADQEVAFPDWAWWATGYSLFIWAILSLVQIWAVTPDILMAAFVFMAGGLLVRIRTFEYNWQTYAFLGCILGLGYLSKAIMLPISALFLAAGFVVTSNLRKAAVGTAIALICFVMVAGPFIGLMTIQKGRFTYGDAGELVYVRHVNHVVYPHWQGEPLGDGQPFHPSRQIFEDPPIYEFGEPIGGTYPISYNPAYWYEGVIVRLDLGNQVKQLISSLQFYADLFVFKQAGIMFSIGLIYSLNRWGSLSLKRVIRAFVLSLVGLFVLLLYAPILVAGRYVGAFVIIFWSDLLSNARLPIFPAARKLISVLSLLMILFLLINVAMFNLQGLGNLTGNGGQQPTHDHIAGPPSWPGAVAEDLWQLGIEPGDQVAVIGYAFDSFWARLAKVQIVAEMFNWQADPFWFGDADFQQQVLLAFKSTGARAVIAENVPRHAQLSGWHQVEDSNYYIIILAKDL